MKRLTILFLLLSSLSFAASPKIRPWVLQNTLKGKQAEFFVVLKEQANLSGATTLTTKIDKGRFVFAMLQDTAHRSQAPLRAWLDSKGVKYQSFYIINALLIKGDRALVNTMAARSDVDRIEGNPVIHNVLPQPENDLVSAPQGIEPNIIKVHAPDLWALGFKGAGIVVGGGDTGYRWTHNALKNKYRGWDGVTANHDYNWHDAIHENAGANPCGHDSPFPCDDFFHGTHTMGTVLGDDGGSNQIGMAPDAKWIGCRNMDANAGTPARYIECFEFFLAPYPVAGTPDQGDPTKAADITTNSWTCPPSEGCSADSIEATIDAQKAAGIMTVAAAANSGPGCSTVDDPPALYDSTYTIGATDNNDNMASFSSRGPANFTNLIKPNIVAPGVGVRSATNTADNAYTNASGTSMATPTVAGGIALIWSAIASLQNQQDATEDAFNGTVVRLTSIVEACGGDYVNGPNNTWGFGRLDVLATYQCVSNPPAVPANIATSLDGGGHPVITWDAAAGATNYEIQRSNGACPGSVFSTIGTVPVTTFTDNTAVSSNTYSYQVRSVQTGCRSTFSACADITVACLYSILPTSKAFGHSGGTGTVAVTTGAACGWTAVSNDDTWLHVTSGATGTGNGSVGYTADANPDGTIRTGTITIGGQTFTVTVAASVCSYSLAPTSANVVGAGTSGTFDVTAPTGCNWTAVSNDTFITIDSGSTGSGNGTVGYTVAANPDPTPRTGTVAVQTQTFTVNQSKNCLYCDDFEDGTLAINWSYSKPQWSETGGALVGVATKKLSAIATPAFAGCMTCTFHTQFSVATVAGSTRVWLMGWYVDSKNTVELLIKPKSGSWQLRQRVKNKIKAKAKATLAVTAATNYDVSIAFDGTSFAVTVNAAPLLTLAPNGTVVSGTVGYAVKKTTLSVGEVDVN